VFCHFINCLSPLKFPTYSVCGECFGLGQQPISPPRGTNLPTLQLLGFPGFHRYIYETILKGKPEMSSENVLQQHSIPSLSQKHKT
jgi:hypothetical protein